MRELAACQSTQVQAVLGRQAWAHLFRRPTLPLPFHGVFRGGLWFVLFREHVASGVQIGGLGNSLAEIVVAACAQVTPSSAPGLVFVQKFMVTRDAIRLMTVVAIPSSSRCRPTSRR